MPTTSSGTARAQDFCEAYGLRVPILLAPMAGACPPSLSIAVANAGGLGACGAVLMQPEAIKAWTAKVRAAGNGAFQFNLWIPDPPPQRDPFAEGKVRAFLRTWGPEVAPDAGDVTPPDLRPNARQCWKPVRQSFARSWGSIRRNFSRAHESRGIRWFATATTVA
jgi:nitronate monooxygenase